MSVHDFTVAAADGNQVELSDYAGRALLIVNTASQCGNTPQYAGLETLQQEFGDEKFTVIGFPCNQFGGQEPGTNEEIQEFCEQNYQVTFPVMAKVDVNGENADPLFNHLKQEAPGDERGPIAWNFAKFLVDAEGNVVKRYAPEEEPESVAPDIQALLASAG
jgi:glutathione peroxidase